MSSLKDSSLARSRIKRSHRIPARLADFREFPQDSSTTSKANSNKRVKQSNSSNSKTPVVNNLVQDHINTSKTLEALNSSMPSFIITGDNKNTALNTSSTATKKDKHTPSKVQYKKVDQVEAKKKTSWRHAQVNNPESASPEPSHLDSTPIKSTSPEPALTTLPTPLATPPKASPPSAITASTIPKSKIPAPIPATGRVEIIPVDSTHTDPIHIDPVPILNDTKSKNITWLTESIQEGSNNSGSIDRANHNSTALKNNISNTIKNDNSDPKLTAADTIYKNRNGKPATRTLSKPQQSQPEQQQNQPNQQQQQQTKYVTNQLTSNMTQSMQFGTRLLINEPVYLPRNIATISPLNSNMQQMEDYVKRLPFSSSKALQCMAYQDKMLLPFVMSNHNALLKIASHLEISDLVRMRRVSKSWKSFIDTDILWKSVRVEGASIKEWLAFGKVLVKKGTTHLHFKNLKLNQSIFKVCEIFMEPDFLKLETLFIESKDPSMNRYAIELLCVLQSNENNIKRDERLKIHWRVKGFIDSIGLYQVQVKSRKVSTMLPDFKGDLYCYNVYPDILTEVGNIIALELDEIRELFNGSLGKDLSKGDPSKKPLIEIEGI